MKLASCPKCHKEFTLPEVAGNVTIACPFCQAHITLRARNAPPPAAVIVAQQPIAAQLVSEDDEDGDEGGQERPTRKNKFKKKKPQENEVGMKLAIVGGILLFAALAIGATYYFIMNPGGQKVEIPDAGKALTLPGSERQGSQEGKGRNERPRNFEEDPPSPDDENDPQQMARLEIQDNQILPDHVIKRFTPETPMPGLETTKVISKSDQLDGVVLDRIKKATVYIVVDGEESRRGSGSGFFALAKGLVVTNAHVIGMLMVGAAEPKTVTVHVNSGQRTEKKYVATIFKVDRKSDLAILKLPALNDNEYPDPLPLASATILQETQRVFAYGFPYGESLNRSVTVNAANVSSLHRKDGRIDNVQFAGALNPGNSGGPIVDVDGRVIAVAVRIYTGRSGSGDIVNTGISFGVPVDEVPALYYGRAESLEVFLPVKKERGLEIPLTLAMKQVSTNKKAQAAKVDAKININVGASSKPTKPEDKSSSVQLDNKDSKHSFRGTLQLPELTEGNVYWIHPQLQLGDKIQWLEPTEYKPTRVLTAGTLPTSPKASVTGVYTMFHRAGWNLKTNRGGIDVGLDYKTDFNVADQTIKSVDVGAKLAGQPMPLAMIHYFWRGRRFGSQPPEKKLKVTDFVPALQQPLQPWLKILDLNLPQNDLAAGAKWQTQEKLLSLDYLWGLELGQRVKIDCEYLGNYDEGKKNVGVVRLSGVMRDQEGVGKPTPYGELTGFALIDAKSRKIDDIYLKVDADKVGYMSYVESEPISFQGSVEVRLKSKQ